MELPARLSADGRTEEGFSIPAIPQMHTDLSGRQLDQVRRVLTLRVLVGRWGPSVPVCVLPQSLAPKH
eukprot:scaffold1355_cov268-Pinguiococcus_pyrenoidosus.AAC.51